VEMSYILLNTRTMLIDRLIISAMMLLKYSVECNILCIPRHIEIKIKVTNSHYIGFWEVKTSIFRDIGTCQPYAPAVFTTKNLLVFIFKRLSVSKLKFIDSTKGRQMSVTHLRVQLTVMCSVL
jgi:hypothetical protein